MITHVSYTRKGSRVTVPVILGPCPVDGAASVPIHKLVFDAGGLVLQNPGVPAEVVGEIWAQILRQGV